MNQHACYHCNLLFEADGPVPCPQCGRPLEPYVEQAPAGAGDERTQLVAPPKSLADVPDPEEMVPVSRSQQPGHVDGGRRSSYGASAERAGQRNYKGGRVTRGMADEQPANRALPGRPEPRKRNTGSLRLGRSSSPPPRSDWQTGRAGRSTREVDLRAPSSPRAPRARTGSEVPRSRGTRDDVARPDVALRDIPQPTGGSDAMRRPRPAPAAAASVPDHMESTRMLSPLDLPDAPEMERTSMVRAVGGSVGGSVGGDQMESTRMLSAIDLANAGPSTMDRTHAISPIDDEATAFARPPGRAAPDPMEDERTRMHGVIDLESTLQAGAGGRSPFPNPSPNPRGGAPSPFPSPSPNPSPSPSPSPRGNAGPSPFPSPSPAGGPSPAPARSDLRRAAPKPLAVPQAAPAPAAVPQAAPIPAAAPQAAPGGDRRTKAIQVGSATPAPVPSPVAAPVAPATPAPVAPAPAAPQPAAPKPAQPAPAQPTPDLMDAYAGYFDARGPSGANLTDAIDAIIGEQREAPAAPVAAPQVRRRRRTNPLIWLAPIILLVGVIVAVAVLYEGPEDDDAAAAVDDDDGPALAGVEQVVAELALALPEARGADPLPDDPPYVVAGAEALRVRGTQRILGVNSVTVPDNVVMDSPEGEWIQPLRDALGSTPRNQLDLLALALDEKVDARAVARFAQSGEKARFESVGLVVRRVEGAGGLGVVPINTGPTEAPSAGRVMIRVGRLSVTILLENRDGPQADPDGKIDNAGGGIDYDKVELRLAALAKAHPLVREAVVTSHAELPLRDLIQLFERARVGEDKERFTRLRLVVK